MRVEVDISDLEELDYYIDQKCEELEQVLREDPQFTECRVKRQHWGEMESLIHLLFKMLME